MEQIRFKNAKLTNEYFFQKFKVGTIRDHSDIRELSLHYDDGQGVLTDDEMLDGCLDVMARESTTPQEGFDSYL